MNPNEPRPPAVSIITPAYNAAPFIEDTIESALGQTFSDFEMIVVDDGSTDETRALVERSATRDPRISIVHQANRGISAARNSAIARSGGRFITLLDSDDLWLPTYLEEQVAILDRRPDISVLSANAINFGGVLDGHPLLPQSRTGEVRPVSLMTLVQEEDSVSIFAMFRREVVETIGGFDNALRRCEDYDLWLRIAAAGLLIAVNPKPLALYRRRPDSLSADEGLMLEAMKGPLTKVLQSCGDRPDVRCAVRTQLTSIAERRLVAGAKTALALGDMVDLASRFDALADATGATRYRVASWLSGRAPAFIRWAYRCKRAFSQLTRPRRKPVEAESVLFPHRTAHGADS